MKWRLFLKHKHGWSLCGIFNSPIQAVEYRKNHPSLSEYTPIRIYSYKSMYKDVERYMKGKI